jgi:hypothetical protein
MGKHNSKFRSKFFFYFLTLIIIFEFFIHTPITLSFNIPERLEYDLTWMGIVAGQASLELINDGDKTRITSTASSAKWVSVFYTVDDRIESVLLKNSSQSFIGTPKQYRAKMREGKHKRDREVIFDIDNKKAFYKDYLNNEEKEFDIPAFIFDPISSFYYIRTLRLVIGEPVYVTIFDNKKIWDVEVQILRKEKINTPAGTYDTIVVKPLLKSDGIFFRKGDIYIWLTDDNKHIPVKLQTKVAVGYVTATLVKGNY